MFKAITKDKAPGDGKGTLTALWGKRQQKEPGGGTPAPPASDQAADAAAENTPAGAAKVGGGAQAAAAPATGGGDVAIGAAPEPSPEPALAAAQAAAAAGAAAAEQQQQPQAAAAGKASGKASGSTGEKKRKRAAADAFSETQLAKLQAAFAENEYPNTAAKAALAEELGVEAAQVSKWFEKQRKLKREETGEAPKRGRHSGKASGGAKPAAAAAPGGDAAAAAAAEGPAAEAAAAEAAEAAQQEGDAMEVDGEAAPAQVAQQQEQQPGPAAEQAAAEAQPMATDAAAAEVPAATPGPAAVAASDATPAPQPSAAAAAAAPAATGATPAADGPSPAAGGSAGKAAGGSGKPGKTPASAAPARIVSAEEQVQLVAALEAEAAELRQQGLAAPLQPLPDAGAAPERQPFSDARLAAAVAGQRAPLSQLTAALMPLFKAPDGDMPLEEAVLRSRIIDLAARKSFGPKDGGAALVDGLEDASADHLWQWELRDQKVLPKELRPAAAAAKKRSARVAERLSAVVAALRLLGAHSGGKAPAKLAKALAALDKAKTLAQIDEEAAAERAAAEAKEAAKKAAAGPKGGLSAEEKARIKAEKEAAKEAERAAKEAEKAAVAAAKEAAKEAERAAREEEKAAKAAEKERLKAEKEAEKERKQREAEAAKAVKKTGFKDSQALQKSSAKFMSFFQAKPGGAPGSAAKPGASQPTPSRGATASQQPSQGGAASQQPAASGAEATGKREKGYAELFPKDSTNVVSQPTQPCRAAEMDAAAAAPPPSFEQAQAEWQALLGAMKERRRQAAAQPRLLGLPPSWARKSGAEKRAAERLQAMLDSGLERSAIRTWRRKFVWCPADSKRPPFYGSCKPSPTVGPRRPFAKDEALDYEVMSDLDWEEEPEGSSLSGDDREEESEAMGGDDDAADSFMVSDGYLSADEGVQLEGLDEDDGEMMAVDVTGPASDAGAGGGEQAHRVERLRLQLEVQMKRAVNGGKPLIISRLPAGSEPAAGSCIRGDPVLLQALAAEVLLPGVRVGLPEDLAAQAPAGAAAGAPATGGKQTSPAVAAGGTAGRPSAGRPRERPDNLLPALMRFVQQAPRKKKNEITDEFIAAHPTRKVPKAWVQAALKEHAEHLGAAKGWALKPSGLALLAGTAAPTAQEGGAAAAAAGAAAGPTPAAAAAAGGAAGGAAAAAAVAGVEPTPAATKPATGAAGIERFFKTDAPMATPAVPSALRPNAPPSELKVPGRLVTTTAAGAEEAAASGAGGRGSSASPGPLAVPDSVSGTTDPFWRELLVHIEGADASHPAAAAGTAGGSDSQQQPRFAAAFQPAVLARLVAGMPAGVFTALVAGVAAAGTLPATRTAYLRCLEAAVHVLAAAEAEAAGDNSLSASQQVWQPRGAPPAASLAELAREPQLLPGLQACATAAAADGSGAAEAQAAAAAAGVARALLGSEPARAAVQAAAAASGGDAGAGGNGLVQQLEALAAAQQA